MHQPAAERGNRAPKESAVPRRANGEFSRAYYACERCRQRKVKCLISGEPPCSKCARERRQCVFPRERSLGQRLPPGPGINTGPQETIETCNDSEAAGLFNDDDRNAAAWPSLIERAMPETMLKIGNTLFSQEKPYTHQQFDSESQFETSAADSEPCTTYGY